MASARNIDRPIDQPSNQLHQSADFHAVIRQATADDLPSILELIHLKAAFDGCPDSVTATAERLQADLFGATASERILLVEVQGVIAGFASYYSTYSTFLAKPGLWLDDLYLKPEFRGQGLGQALMRALCQIAQQAGCERIDWTVATDNDRGIQFYEKIGATVTSSLRLCRLDRLAIAQHSKSAQ
jgi:ribosomal protein S18 acetylase RimI-like enzyme